MPRVIKQVDEIAALRQHEIVYLEFLPKAAGADYWDSNPLRRAVLALLDAEGIPHFPCAPPYSWDNYIDGFFGHEYLGIDPEQARSTLQALADRLTTLELSLGEGSVNLHSVKP